MPVSRTCADAVDGSVHTSTVLGALGDLTLPARGHTILTGPGYTYTGRWMNRAIMCNMRSALMYEYTISAQDSVIKACMSVPQPPSLCRTCEGKSPVTCYTHTHQTNKGPNAPHYGSGQSRQLLRKNCILHCTA